MVDMRDVNNTQENSVEDGPYVYRGPMNKTGIHKNSLLLKDLTGYVEEPEGAAAINETIDAGTQTIVADEAKMMKQ